MQDAIQAVRDAAADARGAADKLAGAVHQLADLAQAAEAELVDLADRQAKYRHLVAATDKLNTEYHEARENLANAKSALASVKAGIPD
jgi:chromosome segregation ATPase